MTKQKAVTAIISIIIIFGQFAAPSSVLPDSYQILIENSDVEIRLPEEQVICPSVSLRAEIVSLDRGCRFADKNVCPGPSRGLGTEGKWNLKAEEMILCGHAWWGERRAASMKMGHPDRETKHSEGPTPSVTLINAK